MATAGTAVGVVLGCVLALHLKAYAPELRRLVTSELVIVNEHDEPVVKLGSSGGHTVLQFLGERSQPALEIGVDQMKTVRFIRFFGRGESVLAALNSNAPTGQSTLYLGDERREARVIMGALPTDVVASDGTEDWGLEFRAPGSLRPLFNVVLKSPGNEKQSTAALSLIRSDGQVWTMF